MNEHTCLCPLTVVLLSALSINTPSGSADEIIQTTRVKGGLVVHVGCGDGRLTAELRAGDSYVVQGLDTHAANVEKARGHIKSLGIYGKVTAEAFDGERLPYTDNVVNLLVASDRYGVSTDEMIRVLAPRGVALIAVATGQEPGTGRRHSAVGGMCGCHTPPPPCAYYRDQGPAAGGEKLQIGGRTWWKIVKPWPGDIDQWTHYLHGPNNNAVAHDTVVGPPRHMQWLASPEWARNHHKLASISSVVTAEGRLFCIVDEATAANINVPGKWAIVARDAFSGVTLWKKPMHFWAWHQLRFRSGPPQVTRLLVASGDRLYAPLGLNSPISVMDAATGKTLKTFEDTKGAEEIILVDGILLVLKGTPVAEHAFGHPAFQDRYKLPNEKAILALDAQTGQTLWRWSDPETCPLPETLASDGRRVYVQIDRSRWRGMASAHTPQRDAVACLDLKSGKQLWIYGQDGQETEKKRASNRVTYGTNTLVVADGVVLCNLSGNLTALAAEDGKKLWECPAGGGFHSPLDIFVIDGLVWQGSHVKDSVAPPPWHDFNECRDLHTGEVKGTNTVMVDLQTSGHHHRCYREKATDRYIITGKRGVEMMDLASSNHSRNNWVRGTCQYGVLPANGLLYAPSHACGCYMESKLRGFWALAANRDQRRRTRDETDQPRPLERGPAYGQIINHQSSIINSSDWLVYRHDPLRSGVATTVLPTGLKRAWNARIGGRLTQPVVAEGKVVLAAVDENTVYALDEKTGDVAWKHVAGGRVDSPPAIYRGMVLFGSADGRVTCLRHSDGELVWRFLAAPADVRAVAFNQVESLWPVHGSVLVLNGVAYCSAGRSTWIDGGIDLYALDPATGKVLCETHFESRHPEFQEGKDQAKPEHETRIDQNTTDYKTFLAPDLSDSFSMAGGTVSDVLVSDGRNVFLHHVKFNPKLEKQQQMSRHLFSTSSLLDGAENHRSHWVLGTGDFSRIPVAYSWIVNRPGKRMPTIAVPTGVMMVFDDQAVWGVRRQGDANGKYHLFKKQNRPFSEDEEPLPDFRHISAGEADQYVWKNDLPVRATAMIKSGDNLYLGVMPVEIPVDDPHRGEGVCADAIPPTAAYEGRLGGSLWVCSQRDGSKIAEYQLTSPVVWDGMAAANGKLFMSTSDGSVLCFAGAR